ADAFLPRPHLAPAPRLVGDPAPDQHGAERSQRPHDQRRHGYASYGFAARFGLELPQARPRAACLQAIAGPERTRLDRREQLFGESGTVPELAQIGPAHAGNPPPEKTALRAHQRGRDLVAEAFAQGGTKVADAIGNAELQGFLSGPIFAGEQRLLRTGERGPAAGFYQ